MSESLKSWLFAHCATTASVALEGQYDLSDLPFQRGNRVQLLRFLTFRPSGAPNSEHTDVWTLVGDRTHCIAARFARDQVDRFHTTHPVALTALKGALVTLTNVRITVARVRVHTTPRATSGAGDSAALPYRDEQYALVLDVRGWDVVSSVHEPVWFGGVKLVTSPNAVPANCEAKATDMMRWMKQWIRYKNLLRRAKSHHNNHNHNHTTASVSTVAEREREREATGEVKVPTPAQRNRKVLVLSSSQAHNTQPPAPPRQADEEHSTHSLAEPAAPTSSALWDDFNLDAEVDVDDIELPSWGTAEAMPANPPVPPLPAASTSAPPPPATIPAPSLSADPCRSAPSQSSSQWRSKPESSQLPVPSPLPTQSPSTSDLDPYESGLSDYERETRLARHHARAGAAAGRDRRTLTIGGEASTTTLHAAQQSAAGPPTSSEPLSHRTSTTTTDPRRVPSSASAKKRKRQQALAALMAQIID